MIQELRWAHFLITQHPNIYMYLIHVLDIALILSCYRRLTRLLSWYTAVTESHKMRQWFGSRVVSQLTCNTHKFEVQNSEFIHIIQSRNFYNIHNVETRTDFLKFVAGTRPWLSNKIHPSNHYRLQPFSTQTTYGGLTRSHSVISSYLQA
jgi:hypothetical protein